MKLPRLYDIFALRLRSLFRKRRVESELERDDDVTMFALETLTASRIMVATTAELPRIALSVRQQMGLQ